MRIAQIIECLEAFAPLRYQEDYDNAGLLVGNAGAELSNALLTLDVTEAVIAEAVGRNCNLVIAHHPLIWRGLKKITGSTWVERAVMGAIRQDIAIYAAHTNLDNMRLGVSNRICDRLGLTRREILFPLQGVLKKLVTFVPPEAAGKVRDALFGVGAGHIGNYGECSFNTEGTGTFKGDADTHPYAGSPGVRHDGKEIRIEVVFPAHLEQKIISALLQNHPYEEVAYDILLLGNAHGGLGAGMTGELPEAMEEKEFLQFLKERMQAGCVRHTPLCGRKVKKIAVCGGAGSFLLKTAIRAGAEVFVSADFKYHEFFEADNHIVIADIGHYESEQFTVDLFYDLLTGNFPNFAPLKSTIRSNPVNYL